MINIDYYDSIIKDLTDVLWDEHGRGIRNRTTLVGVDYFNKKYGNKLIGQNVQDTVEAVINAMKEEGLITAAEYDKEDIVVKVKFSSCVHLKMEKQLMEGGVIGIVNCPCANIIMHFISKLTGRYCELAVVNVDENECTATIAVMGNQGG